MVDPSSAGYPAGLIPYDAALRAYFFDRRADASITVHSDLGEHDAMPVEVFFRDRDGLFPFEQAALDACRGRVLELGAGSGSDALVLADRGFEVEAVDFVPAAVEVMRARGVGHVVHADWRTLGERDADTVLLLMNGAGWTGTLRGLAAFFRRARALIAAGGQIVLDGGPARGGRVADETMSWPDRTGPYPGEAWVRLEFDGRVGEPFRELYVDCGTLADCAGREGWTAQRIYEGESDTFVARLRLR